MTETTLPSVPLPRAKPPRAVATLLVLAAPCLIALNACNKKPADDTAKPVVSVEAVHPQTGVIAEDIEGDATLAPIAQAAIQAKITAPIRRFYVQRGQHVAANQLLVTLENKDLAASALDNQGTYTAARGAFATATQLAVPQEQTQARLDFEQARATLNLDQNILNARMQLFQQGAIPGRDVDTARATVQQAQAALELAQQKYDAIQNVGHTASIETAQGQLTSAKGKFLSAEAQLSYTNLRTPIRGVVTDRPNFAGETAAAGTAIVTVMDTSTMIAKLHLAQAQAQQLALGAPAQIEVPGVDAPLTAKVALVSPALDPGSTTVEVWLKVANPDGALKSGTAVHATIKGRTIPNALLIPSVAVQRSSEGAGNTVLVIAPDGTAHNKNVTIGIQTKDTTQIVEGLSPADTVITTGGYGLDEGTRVKIKKPGEQDETPAAATPPRKPAAGGDKD